MHDAVVEMLRGLNEFARGVIESNRDVGSVMSGLRMKGFLIELQAFNENHNIHFNYPFHLVSKIDLNGGLVPETLQNEVIMAADNVDLADEFIKIPIRGHSVLFFTHKAKAFVQSKCTDSLGLANIGSNGLVLETMQFTGFFDYTEADFIELIDKTNKFIIK